MTAHVFSQSSLRQLKGVSVVQGLVARPLRRISVFEGVGKTIANFAPPLSVTLNTNLITGGAFGGSATTNTVTAIPIGGSGPFTYTWSVLIYSGGVPLISTPTLATVFVGANVESAGQIRISITDSLGSVASANCRYILQDYR